MVRSIPFYLFIVFGLICLALLYGLFNKKQPDFLVVNVLSEQLYDDSHIKGSICVPFQELDSFIKNLDAHSHVVFYCSNYMCTSSGYAAKKAREHGIKNACAYEGGTAEWYQMGLPIEGPCKQMYLSKKVGPSKQEAQVDDIVISAHDLAHKMGIVKGDKVELQ